MPGLEEEVVQRVRRWCAEAGREATPAEIQTALGRLSWVEMLAVKALLADPPPARPLGPLALVDIARGAPPDLAADRERAGRYRPEAEIEAAPPPSPGRAPPSGRRAPRPAVVVRRARDRVPPVPPEPAPLPSLEALRAPAGRGVLERLIRRHGGRTALAAAIADRWRRPDGLPPGEADLVDLLDHHGLSRAFARRERDEILHALRAAGGLRARAAAGLGLGPAGLDAALERLGATGEAERIRAERRQELRARGTLAERAALLLRDEERLADLDLLGEFERDLAERLPGHVRALAAGEGPVRPRLARSLGLSRAEALSLASRFGLPLGGAPEGAKAPRAAGGIRRTGPPRARPPRRGPPRAGAPARGKGARRRPAARRPL